MVAAVSRSITISAPQSVIFAILADPRQHVLIDGSGTVKGTRSAPARLALGTRFRMRMQLGIAYRVRNTVIEFEEGRRIAWRHRGRHVWRYELEPQTGNAEGADGTGGAGAGNAPGGKPKTLVTETFDPEPALARWFIALAGFPARNTIGIEKTLERLKRAAESRA
jgi:hypothetical protein